MSTTIEATYNGEVLILSEALDILPDTKVWVTVNTDKPQATKGFLDIARSIRIEGPEDWSENLESYLYDGKTA